MKSQETRPSPRQILFIKQSICTLCVLTCAAYTFGEGQSGRERDREKGKEFSRRQRCSRSGHNCCRIVPITFRQRHDQISFLLFFTATQLREQLNAVSRAPEKAHVWGSKPTKRYGVSPGDLDTPGEPYKYIRTYSSWGWGHVWGLLGAGG
jgi:hypothetical protein